MRQAIKASFFWPLLVLCLLSFSYSLYLSWLNERQHQEAQRWITHWNNSYHSCYEELQELKKECRLAPLPQLPPPKPDKEIGV